MNIIIHNLKVAVRNLMKYKLQTFISVVSIAIGIVTLSFAHSIMTRFRFPAIYDQPYSERAYNVSFKSVEEGNEKPIDIDIIRAVKRDGGPRCAERIAVPNSNVDNFYVEFHLTDSTVRRGNVTAQIIDPEYANYAGFRSAITGKKIKKLKPGEAIISEAFAKHIFHDANPIGAVQTYASDFHAMAVTIVDIYQNLSIYDLPLDNHSFYSCVTDSIENQAMFNDSYFYAFWINAVLKEGCKEQQLLREINERVKPLGLEATLSKTLNDDDLNINMAIRGLAYIICSLILLAAIIGFLRIQTQLFWLRRREISLRVVNGANRMQLFCLLITETAISICLSVITAVLLSFMLQDFFETEIIKVTYYIEFDIVNLWFYSLVIGGAVLALCCLIIWITLARICKSGQGLAASMRRSRNHLFRNVMLGIQIVISIIFVCGTFILGNGAEKILKSLNIPENDDFYKTCLLLKPPYASQPERLVDEIKRLPDLDRMIVHCSFYTPIKEIKENPDIEKLQKQAYFFAFYTTDTTIVSFLGMDVEWFNQDIDRNQCLLIGEELYRRFEEYGILGNNTLSVHVHSGNGMSYQPFPIAGIIKNVPYVDRCEALVVINPDEPNRPADGRVYLVPKAGRGKALARSVDETIERLEPECINKIVFNFREDTIPQSTIVEIARTGGWILGCVSMIICIMSIFSTIALDTRARKKEVAIRKVNGAKGKHIYRMFGRVYVVLIVVALFIAVPVCVMFNLLMETIVTEAVPGATLSPVVPIILGIVVVTLLILLIVGWQIHRVMQVNPSEIIAKE
ncbi:MAG: ABC transporter permease [Prevotella sp.]|nr:ABC transporter permease [Prevotella sp.]